MKRSVTFIANKTAALAGRFILFVYKAYTSRFINKADFPLPFEPVRQREIILVRKTGQTHRVVADTIVINLS